MKITPEAFIEEQTNKSYEELLSVRDELIAVVRKFEADDEQDPEDVLVSPLPDGNYYCNMKLLGELCKLIADKFGDDADRAKG